MRIRVSAGSFPIGAGLGSSAAFGVALAGALAHYRELPSPVHEHVELINAFAFSSEVILHGSPSGVDNTVSAFGGALMFRKLPVPAYERLTCDLSQFRFLIVNTQVPRSTKEQVANVRRRYEADPSATQRTFQDIERIVSEFIELGEQGALTSDHFGRQIVQNHKLLKSLGVGHAKIEEVVHICGAKGISTKLTGAGGGGCTVSLLPHHVGENVTSEIVSQLESNGFQCFTSSVGGKGFDVEFLE